MREIFSAIGWQARILAHLARAEPRAMLIGICFGLVGHVAHVLAFLLPLKVILLAGSTGVPRFLALFIAPEQKGPAILILGLAAVLCYALALFCDAIVKRQSLGASMRILQETNAIAIINNQGDEAGSVFLRFTQIGANLLFVVAVLSFLSWINPPLLVCLLALILAAFLYLAGTSMPRPAVGRVEPPTRRDIGTRLKILASIAFFMSFTVILLPFVMSAGGGDVLAALVTFVLVRQVLSVLPRMVRESIELAGDRPLINALLFREHKFERLEKSTTQSFRKLFEKSARVDRMRVELGERLHPGDDLDVVWMDARNRDFQTFEVQVRAPGAAVPRLYLERVIPPNRKYLAENELFLFENISREALKAPPLVARFAEGRFDCLVSEIGEAEPCRGGSRSREILDDLLEHCWGVEPGRHLVTAYCASHPLLHARIKEQLLSRIEVALDDAAERQCYRDFLQQLPQLQEALRRVPLYVFNPHLEAAYLYRRADGEPVVTSWSRWALQPIGAALPSGRDAAALSRRLERARLSRPSIPGGIGGEHLLLVHKAIELERAIERNHLKRALDRMDDILSNPILTGTSGRVAARRARPEPEPEDDALEADADL